MVRHVFGRVALAMVLALATLGSGTPSSAAAADTDITGYSILSDDDTDTWRAPEFDFPAPMDIDDETTVGELYLFASRGRYLPISIGAPEGQALAVGHYPTTSQRRGTSPLFKIQIGCLEYVADFTVVELVLDGDAVDRLAVDFTVRCGTWADAWHGSYRYRSTIGLFGPSFAPGSVTTNSISMGTVLGGSTSSETSVPMWNLGTVPIAIDTISFIGRDAAHLDVATDPCSGTILAPGASCAVGITFSPPERGIELRASLAVASDGPRSSFGIPIVGRGATLTATELTTPSIIEAFVPTRLTARVTPVQPNVVAGAVQFWVDGERIDTAEVDDAGVATMMQSHVFADQTYVITAKLVVPDFLSPPVAISEATKTITGRRNPQLTVTSSEPTTVQEGTPLTFTATMHPSVIPSWGDLRIRNGVSGEILASKAVTTYPTTVTSPPVILPVGDTPIIAEFVGDPIFLDRPAVRIQTVTKDASVAVIDVTVGPTPFYPSVDGYRDALAIKGRLLEPATVSVLIYDADSVRVRTIALGLRDGAYATSWNGRRSDGRAVPAGTYKVVQVLTDGLGNQLRRETSVIVSWRTVKWVSASITKYGNAFLTTSKGSTGSISKNSSFAGGIRLSGGSASSGYALVRWSFTLRSALAYKNLSIQALGKSTTSSARAILAFGQDEIGTLIGPSYRWWTRSGGVTGHVNGRTVLLDVETDGPMSGAFDVARTRVTYRYAVWS